MLKEYVVTVTVYDHEQDGVRTAEYNTDAYTEEEAVEKALALVHDTFAGAVEVLEAVVKEIQTAGEASGTPEKEPSVREYHVTFWIQTNINDEVREECFVISASCAEDAIDEALDALEDNYEESAYIILGNRIEDITDRRDYACEYEHN